MPRNDALSLLIVLAFLGIAVLGMPLAFALGIGGVAGLIASDVDFNLLPTRMMNAINAFPLMSIPFFILAGELMMKAGIMDRLIDLASAVCPHGKCTAVRDTVVLYRDARHLTARAARLLAPALGASLAAVGW